MENLHLPDGTHLGTVYLRVRELERSLAFYRDLLGLRVVPRVEGVTYLAASPAGPALLGLIEHPDAPPRPPRTIGLYHFALLLPERLDLARVVHRIMDHRWQIQGASDHSVSEAVYLADPDGNGVELYIDRPPDLWRWEGGEVVMRTMPLDLPGLLLDFRDELESWTGIAAGTRVGHIHLHVSDLDRAESFYHGLLGFEVMTRSYPGALFLAAGGYHHHIGVNVWISAANPLPPDDAAGLLAFEVVLPDPALVRRIRDDAKRRGVETIPARDGFRLRDQDGNGVVLRHL
jgi:catechol 2,3-dioxygenase